MSQCAQGYQTELVDENADDEKTPRVGGQMRAFARGQSSTRKAFLGYVVADG